jgi:hypothetical protein
MAWRTSRQGKRIWILRTQVSGRKVDSGGIGQLLVAEIHAFEGNVRANNTVRSQIQTASGFFCSSDVKEIPNAFALDITVGAACRPGIKRRIRVPPQAMLPK